MSARNSQGSASRRIMVITGDFDAPRTWLRFEPQSGKSESNTEHSSWSKS